MTDEITEARELLSNLVRLFDADGPSVPYEVAVARVLLSKPSTPPETSEWNAAIEAAAKVVETAKWGSFACDTVPRVRALSRPSPQPERTERRWTLEEIELAADSAFDIHPDAIEKWRASFRWFLEHVGSTKATLEESGQ